MHWIIGDIRITAIFEQPLEQMAALMPDVTITALKEVDWLSPHFVDADGTMLGVIQCFVVEVDEITLVIDTCVGDDKDLPLLPSWHRATTGFLDRFRSAGFDPENVDLVLCTHMHVDHVGWNTQWDGEHWVPTFPHARYLFGRQEFDYWERTNATSTSVNTEGENDVESISALMNTVQLDVHRDSIRPILDAGLADVVEVPYEPAPGIRLVPTPGHTPGHASVAINSRGASAFITGDSFHHPCQIAYPQWGSVADDDQDESFATRMQVLESLAGTDTIMLGSHFAAPTGGRIVRAGKSFRFDWTTEKTD